jgi:hypothetical protein
MTREHTADGPQSRRGVLKGIAGAGAGLATLGVGSQPVAAGDKGGDCDPDGDPARIDTSDHYDTTWYGDVYLTDGNTATNYDRAGGELPSGLSELVVHVHGWRNGESCGIASIEATGGAYEAVGYDQPVTGLTWDSSYAWWNSKEIAAGNGPKLADFLTDYKSANPETTIRVQAHSLGARVLAETLLALDDAGEDDVVTSAIFMAGAIDNESVAVDGKYGDAISNATTHTENFWMRDDSVLEWAYETYEWSSAIGNEGCDGTPPDNYTDREVTKDIGHSDYYDDQDVIGQIQSTFQ